MKKRTTNQRNKINNSSSSNSNSNSEKEEEEKLQMPREEVVRRRSNRVKKLRRIYRDYYWSLIEHLKSKHKHFLWTRGTLPFPSSSSSSTNNNNNSSSRIIINNNNNNDNTEGVCCCCCCFCRKKAMALTRFCHSHILSDPNQLLYKPCSYPTKSSPSGPTLCMKPILKSAVPSLCSSHLEKAEKHLSRCLRKEGFNVFGTNKHPPKFNVVVAEFVRQIQSNRRENL